MNYKKTKRKNSCTTHLPVLLVTEDQVFCLLLNLPQPSPQSEAKSDKVS